MKCDVIAQGVINAAKQLNLSLPVIVRLQVFICYCCFFATYSQCLSNRQQGTNVEQANKLLAGNNGYSTLPTCSSHLFFQIAA